MAGICYRKGYEKGLWYEIQSITETIEIKRQLGKDASFEKGLLKAYKKYSEEDYRKPVEQS